MALEIDLGPETESFRAELREWLAANHPSELEGVEITPGEQHPGIPAWTEELAEAGYLCVSWPVEYGGRGLSGLEVAVMNEEFARVGIPRVTRGMGEWLVGPSIIVHGTDEQKRRFLPRIIAGEDTYCQGFSEPDAGSDLAGLQTKGVVDGDELVITGQKVWTSGAAAATMMFCLARTDPDAPKHRGISYVLVPMRLPDGSSNGIDLRPIKQITGASHFTETFLDGARAPLDNVIGGLNDGWRVTMTTLGNERGGNATTQHVAYTRDFWRTVDLARKRGKEADPTVRQQLAWAYSHCEIMRFAGLRTLSEVVARKEPGPAASINKMFWSEYAQRFGEIQVGIAGAAAMIRPGDADDAGYALSHVQRQFLSTRSVTIWGGTAQVQRNIVGERVLGLPKEPGMGAATGQEVERRGRGGAAVSTTTTGDPRVEALSRGMVVSYFAEHHGDEPAVIQGDRTVPFSELNARANQLVRALRARGVGPGDGIALMCSNRIEFVEACAAAERGGLRLTPVNWHLNGDEAGYIVDDCEAVAFVADARFAEAAAEAAAAAPRATVRLAVGGPIDGFDDYDAAVAAEDGDDISDPQLGTRMLYTSGTTGRPKGVYRPPASAAEAAITAAAAATVSGYRAGTGQLHLCTGPLYHAAPLLLSLAPSLNAGVGVVLMDGWDAKETLELVDRHRITHSHMVPTMFHRLLSLPQEVRDAHDVSSLQFVIHGAAPCPVPVKAALIEWWGPIVYEYYAATEGSGTTVGSADWLKKPGTVGKPVTEDHIRILDEAGEALPANQAGTVYLKSPAVGRFTYFKDESKTAGAYKGDWYTLGDVGYLDDDGWLFLTDRSAHLIISGGVNIYPAEVEAVLLTHPDVGDVGVIGVPNDEWGEEVKAVVEPQPGVEPTPALAAELLAFCRDKLAGFKCPRSVDFTDALPRHDNGKLYKQALRAAYRQVTPPS